MPINGFDSICEDHAPRITSQDRGNPQKHIAHNDLRSYVTHYAIDGVVIKHDVFPCCIRHVSLFDEILLPFLLKLITTSLYT